MWKSLLSDNNKNLMAQKTTKPKPKKAYTSTMRRLSQFDGPKISNTPRLSLTKEIIPKVVDTSLFVGPVYDATKNRQSVIKEQLGDITERLHKTLNQYDVMDEVERAPPRLELMENLTRNIDNIDRDELKGHLEGFMMGYKDLTSSVEESNKEREELLMQVADWMTTDHTDLDDLKMSMDDKEASEISSEYITTVADLEKLKSLKEEIIKCDFNGKNTKFLEQEKKRLEKSVMEGLAEMKQNKQKGAGESKAQEDAHWKHAAGEVVQLLNKVRTENSVEKEALANKMTQLLTQIDRQQVKIRSLQGEVRKEKNVAAHLADDNADLTKELMQLRAKIVKYEKDLEQAKKVISRQLSNLSTLDDDSDESSTSIDRSVSEILQRSESHGLRETSSDPAILRSCLRELKENVATLTKELNKAAERMKEVELMNMELENRVEELENKPPEVITEIKTVTEEVIVTKAPSFCECHLPKVEKKPSVNLELVAAKEEIEKLTEKNQYYKKALYETEMKLSDAYKEIAELRVLVDKYESLPVEKQKTPVPSPPSPEPVQEEEVIQEVEEVVEEEVEEVYLEDVPTEPPKIMKKGSIEEPPKMKPKQAPPKPKPVRKHVARKPPPTPKKSTLPPIRQKKPPPPMPDLDEISRSERGQVLWTVGELQAMMNGIIQDIMEFSTLVGNMIYKEKEEDQIQQPTLRTFDFGQTPVAVKNKGKKPVVDRIELEAKDKKSQVFFLGQKSVAIIREIYEILSNSLELLHEEFEMIYRSFKEIQQRKALEKAILSGQLPEHIKLPGHDATGGPGSTSMQFHGATAESLLTYYVHAYGQMKRTQEKKRGGYVLSESVPATAEHRPKSVDVTSVKGDSSSTMQNAVMVLGIHRSKSEVDINSVISNDSATSMKRSQTHLFMSTKVGEHLKPEVMSLAREEARVATTTVPKKGLIKLTALENELDGTFNFGVNGMHGRDDTSDMEEIERQRRKHSLSQGKQKMLIRRKNIQDQVLAGKQLLEEEERQKEEQVDMEKALEEYTMRELSQNLTQYIGSNKKKTGSGIATVRSKGKVYEQVEEPKQQRTITLPAINTLNINVFGS